MKNKIILLILILSLLLSLLSCKKTNEVERIEKEGLIFEKCSYNINHNEDNKIEGYEVVGCYEDISAVNIPEFVNGVPVVAIKEGAFEGNNLIKEFSVPKAIYKGFGAFKNCDAIEKITVPSSDFSYLFAHDVPKSLKCVVLSEACTSISTGDFSQMYFLQAVYIPKTVLNIEDGTNYTHIGVNGHKPADKFDNLPFYNCDPELKIYCETQSKPAGWGDYWNYINNNRELTVFWESDISEVKVNYGNSDTEKVSGDDPNVKLNYKLIATLNESTIRKLYSSNTNMTVRGNRVNIGIVGGGRGCGFVWNLSDVEFKPRTKYVIMFKNVSINKPAWQESIGLLLDWYDSDYHWPLNYNSKTTHFQRDFVDDCYIRLDATTYSSLEIEFIIDNSNIKNVEYVDLYFKFYDVERSISFYEVSIYELTYEQQ